MATEKAEQAKKTPLERIRSISSKIEQLEEQSSTFLSKFDDILDKLTNNTDSRFKSSDNKLTIALTISLNTAIETIKHQRSDYVTQLQVIIDKQKQAIESITTESNVELSSNTITTTDLDQETDKMNEKITEMTDQMNKIKKIIKAINKNPPMEENKMAVQQPKTTPAAHESDFLAVTSESSENPTSAITITTKNDDVGDVNKLKEMLQNFSDSIAEIIESLKNYFRNSEANVENNREEVSKEENFLEVTQDHPNTDGERKLTDGEIQVTEKNHFGENTTKDSQFLSVPGQNAAKTSIKFESVQNKSTTENDIKKTEKNITSSNKENDLDLIGDPNNGKVVLMSGSSIPTNSTTEVANTSQSLDASDDPQVIFAASDIDASDPLILPSDDDELSPSESLNSKKRNNPFK